MSTSEPRPGPASPDDDRPGTDRPGTDRPGTSRPGTDRPGADTGSRALRPSDLRTSGGPDPAFPEPRGPRTTGAGGHLLGILVGLVLTPLALAVMALGMSRILSANGPGQDPAVLDAPGIALVTVGAVIAALVALLAVRSSAIPVTGGLTALALGAAYLFAPEATHRETVRLLGTEQNTDALLDVLTVFLLGVPFVVGLVLLASGTAASLGRRRGIAVGSFRERSRGTAARG